MTEFCAIEIDFEVHKCIELERSSFSESPNTVLRRLLKLSPLSKRPTPTGGRAWSGKGVTLPHGTELRMDYNGSLHRGQIADGKWSVEGKSENNPSPAASAVALTKQGKRTQLDGWKYWEVKLPGSNTWVAIASLRSATPAAQAAREKMTAEIMAGL